MHGYENHLFMLGFTLVYLVLVTGASIFTLVKLTKRLIP